MVELPKTIDHILVPESRALLVQLLIELVTKMNGNHSYIFENGSQESDRMAVLFPGDMTEKNCRYFRFHDMDVREHYSMRYDTRNHRGVITDDFGLSVDEKGRTVIPGVPIEIQP